MSECLQDGAASLTGRSDDADERGIGVRSSLRLRAVRDLPGDDGSSERPLRPVVCGFEGRIGEEPKEMAPFVMNTDLFQQPSVHTIPCRR
jgi:hypothetical protein